MPDTMFLWVNFASTVHKIVTGKQKVSISSHATMGTMPLNKRVKDDQDGIAFLKIEPRCLQQL